MGLGGRGWVELGSGWGMRVAMGLRGSGWAELGSGAGGRVALGLGAGWRLQTAEEAKALVVAKVKEVEVREVAAVPEAEVAKGAAGSRAAPVPASSPRHRRLLSSQTRQ